MKEFEKTIDDIIKKFDEIIKSYGNINRADPNIFSNIKVVTETGSFVLKAISSIVGSSDGSRKIRVNPFDSKNIKSIAKALMDAEMGSVQEGKTEILIILNPVTKDFKEKIVKECKVLLENFKVRMRQMRQDFLNNLKAIKSENEKKSQEKAMQKIFDDKTKIMEKLYNDFANLMKG